MDESLEKIVQEAGTAYSEGRFDDARNLYESALLGNPNNGILHANLSAILLKLKETQKSLDHSKRAVELCPNWAKAHYRRGEALRHNGDDIEAMLEFCQGLKLDSTNFQILKGLEEIVKRKFESFPWKSLEKLKLEKSAPIIISTIGQLLLNSEHFEESSIVLEIAVEMVETAKFKKSIIESLATAYCGLEKYEKAIGCYLRLLAMFEQKISDSCATLKIRENLAEIAEQCVEYYQLAAVQRTFRIDSGDLNKDEILLEKMKIARIYLKMGQPDDSICILKDCQNNFKCQNDPEFQQLLGVCYCRKKEYREALSIMIPISRSTKNQNLELIETINRCFIELDDLTSSIEFLNKMVAENQNNDNLDLVLHSYGLLCQTQISASNLPISLKIAKKILKISKGCNSIHESNAYRLLAIIYEHQKDFGSAIILWKKYLEFGDECVVDRVKALIQLAQLAEDPANAENARKYYDLACRHANTSSDTVICHSAKYRWLLANCQLTEAEKELNVLRKHLEIEPELEPKFKSLIFEDISSFAAKTSPEKFRNLEQSLTEAQDDGDIYREAQILERIGRILQSQGRYKPAQKYFNQQLEVAREVRNAKMMAESHANIARLTLESANFAAASEHARNSLTLYKLARDQNETKVEMLIVLARSEMARDASDVALSAAEKAIALAEECEANHHLATAYRLAADLFRTTGQEEQMIIEMVQHHINFFEYEKSEEAKFQSLIELFKYSRKENLLEIILSLEGISKQQLIELLEIVKISEKYFWKFSKLFVQKFEDRQILDINKSPRIFELYTEVYGDPETVENGEIEEFLKTQKCPKFAEKTVWDMRMTDDWAGEKYAQHYEMAKMGKYEMMADGVRLVDRIVCGAFCGEFELIQMWYQELLLSYHEDPLDHPRCLRKLPGNKDELLRYSASFIAISMFGEGHYSICDVLTVLEKCELEIFGKCSSGYYIENRHNIENQKIGYIFKVSENLLIIFENHRISWNFSKKLGDSTFYEMQLIKYLGEFGCKKIDYLECQLVFGTISNSLKIDAEHTRFWINSKKNDKIFKPKIAFLNLTQLEIPNFTNIDSKCAPTQISEKIEESQKIVLCCSTSLPSFDVMRTIRQAPPTITWYDKKEMKPSLRKLFELHGSTVVLMDDVEEIGKYTEDSIYECVR